MPIASLFSGIGALVGSGLAAAKVYRDDKQSRCPPPMNGGYGYPIPYQPQQMYQQPFVAPMMYPPPPPVYGYQYSYAQQPYVSPYPYQGYQQPLPPPVTPQPSIPTVDPNYELRKQIFRMILEKLIDQCLEEKLKQRANGCMQPPVVITTSSSKPLWETAADGATMPQSQPTTSYSLATIPKPIVIPQPQPQQMYVPPAPPPVPTVRFVQPEHLINESVIRTQPPVIPSQQPQLQWEVSNASNVDPQGFQSFVDHISKPSIPDNYVGNTLDW